MKKKQLAAMALAAVMLTGCGGGSAAPDATKAADSGASTAADAGKKRRTARRQNPVKPSPSPWWSPLPAERTAVLREYCGQVSG
mgnify:CR=1 FL=1